jgi:biopolymer transport protein ExbD
MRRRHRKQTSEVDLNITPFLNLMIVLVPVLLLSMVFTQTRIMELSFSESDGAAALEDQEELSLYVVLRDGTLEVGDSKQGPLKRFEPGSAGDPDFEAMRELLREIKKRFPDKRDIRLLASPGTSYQTLVSAMDHIRGYPEVVAANVVTAELFPDIALGDAPPPSGDGNGEGS